MRYGVLFEVIVLHDYWLNANEVVHEALAPDRQRLIQRQHAPGDYLEVSASPATRARLAGHGMLFKPIASGFLVGVELDGASNVPRQPLESEAVLTFRLRIADPRFFNYTAGVAPDFYRFSNSSGNEHAGRPFLSRPVAPNQATRAYGAGDIRSEVSGAITSLFQAVRDTGPSATPVGADWQRIPADTHDPTATYQQGAIVLFGNELFRALVSSPGADLTDATQWSNEGALANQYVTRDDALALRPEVFSVDVSGAGATTVELTVTRPGALTPVWRRRFDSTDPLTSVQADLRGLSDGEYRLEVLSAALAPLPGLGLDFYLSSQAIVDGSFGVIEVRPGLGNFALLDPVGQLRSPRFELRFLNLASRWRYHFPVTQPTGSGADVVPDPADASVLVTPLPQALTRIGMGVRLRADDSTTPAVSEQIMLPQPDGRSIRKQNNQWFSEVHLSNFPTLS